MNNKAFQLGERFVHVDEGILGKEKWVLYFSCIDFDSGILHLYNNEEKEKLKKSVLVDRCEFFDAVKTKNRPCTIKIQPVCNDKPKSREYSIKSIYVSTDSLRSIDEMKVELEECNGTFEGIDKKTRREIKCLGRSFFFSKSQGGLVRLERIDYINWTKSDVKRWMKAVKTSKECEKVLWENDVDGTILDELDRNTLASIGVKERDVENLVIEIERLKTSRTFSKKRYAVTSKFEKLPGFRSKENEFRDMIDSLCDVAKLKHTFLSTADLQSHTMREGGAKMKFVGYDGEKELEQYNEHRLIIKMVVTEILSTKKAKKIREIVSPIMSTIPKFKTDFGLFHTALIVGPWYLEWTDSELIIPKRMVSGRAIISADVDSLNVTQGELKDISDKISEVVIRWNTMYKYTNTQVRGTKQFEGNCQDFCDDILKAIGVKTKFEGALGIFLNKMRKTGKCTLEFTPSKEFLDFFGIKEKSWVFKTHEELDSFCIRIKEKCLDVFTAFWSEWSLLKSFDRAFWLRHLKMTEDPRYTPLPPKERTSKAFNTGCPFDDPRNTKSYGV